MGEEMREIKFRAWVPKMKKMFYSVGFCSRGVEVYWYDPKMEEETVLGDRQENSLLQHVIPMQYTGLKDKNGKEIYEGDVVVVELLHYPGGGKEKLIGEYASAIIFQDGCFVFYDGYEYHVPCQPCFRTKIIGNIHENPDLLKEK